MVRLTQEPMQASINRKRNYLPILMASKIVEKAPSWVTRLLLPEIQEMKGEIKAVNVRIDGISKELEACNRRIDESNKRIDDLKDYLRDNLNIIQRLTVLEQQIRELKKE